MQLLITVFTIAILGMSVSPAVTARKPDATIAKRFDSEPGFPMLSTHRIRQAAHDWESSSKPSAVAQPEATPAKPTATSTPNKRSLEWYKETRANKKSGGGASFGGRAGN